MMKKIFSTLAITLLIGGAASAQNFTFTPSNDTVTASTTGQGIITSNGFDQTLDMSGYINNNSSASQTYQWQLLSDSTECPAGWILTGICDNIICRTPYSQFYYHVEQQTLPVAAGGTCLMEARLYLPASTGNGVGIVRVRVRTVSATDTSVTTQADTLVFKINKTPTGVTVIKMDDSRVSVYPNPATNKLSVSIDKELNAAQVSIYSINGAKSSLKAAVVKGTTLTDMDVTSLPAGIYFARIEDASGNIITTRKFAKR